MKDDLEIYAAILTQLARGADRAGVLAQHGLDEETFDALEDRALELLSEEEAEGVPAAIVRLDAAIRGGAGAAPALPSLEAFAQAYLIAQEGGNVAERLKDRGFSLDVLLKGSAHYVPRFAKEPELLDHFRALTSRSGPAKKS